MKFEPKISGTKVTDFEIHSKYGSIIPLNTIDKLKPKTAQWLMDSFYLVELSEKGKKEYGCHYCIWVDMDTEIKINIMEDYPQYEKELEDYFGTEWYKHYLRFNH